MIGGFGVKPGNDNWGREVTVDSSTKPTWVVLSEDGSKGEGRWKSETLFSTVVVFDEPPTWQTEYVSWEVSFLSFEIEGCIMTRMGL
jgi:hypothetical protein